MAQQGTTTQRGAADVNEVYVNDLKTDMAGLVVNIETFGTSAIGVSLWVEQSNYCASQDMFFAGTGAASADTNGCVQISPQ